MLRQILLPSFALALTSGMAQQVLFSEDFEGAQPAFTLNTTDVGSTASGANSWLVNDAYIGGSGSFDCLGFPFSFTVPSTSAQPSGISNANGNYLHITSSAAASSGILNANFAAADGFCTDAANHFARMASDVNTQGASDATLTFWWLCAGGPNSYGEVYFSTDAGTNWTQVTTPVANYNNQSAWIQQTISLPVFAGQPTLRFGFRFVNAVTTVASDPAFGIDDVFITTTTEGTAIEVDTLASSSYCPGSVFLVPYTITGAWGAGNVFTAELSDVNGSFALPVAIGSVASTTSGTISATIPAGAALGTGYLVRVSGSDPVGVTGVSTTVITISEAPFAGNNAAITLCSNGGPHALINDLPGASACGAWTGPDGSAFPDTLLPSLAPGGEYTYTTNCPGNCPQDSAVVIVSIAAAPDAGISASVTICANATPINLFSELEGTPDAGGVWSGSLTGGMYDPAVDSSGCFTYTVAGTSPCLNATGTVCVLEDPCTGIDEANSGLNGLRWLGQLGSIQRVALGGNSPDAVELLDVSGRGLKVLTHVDGQTLSINMADMASGVYLVRIHSADHIGVLRLVNE